jgi:hypothetical protein
MNPPREPCRPNFAQLAYPPPSLLVARILRGQTTLLISTDEDPGCWPSQDMVALGI